MISSTKYKLDDLREESFSSDDTPLTNFFFFILIYSAVFHLIRSNINVINNDLF